MNLASLLTADRVVPHLNSTDHWEVIVELVDELCAHGHLEQELRESTLEALAEREEKISTGIGSGVAIPHAFSEDIDEVITIFGRSEEGVNFEAIDNNPVHFIILFVVPEKEHQMHLRTLAAIAKLFTRGDVREQLRKADDAEEILSVFSAQATSA